VVRTKWSSLGSTALALAAALMISTSSVDAAPTISFNSASGTWVSSVPGVTGLNTDTISWGTSTGSGQSSYNFTGTAPPPITDIPLNTLFNLGEFTHNNQPITGTVLQSAVLQVDWDLNIVDGGATNVTGSTQYTFLHNETPNTPGSCPPGSGSVCDDIVTFQINPSATDTIDIGGVDYVVAISGFLIGGSPASQFMTLEGQSNTAVLQGIVTQRTSVVPIPGAVWLFGTALAGLGLTGWRRKKIAA
jgi:hypothetical protein